MCVLGPGRVHQAGHLPCVWSLWVQTPVYPRRLPEQDPVWHTLPKRVTGFFTSCLYSLFYLKRIFKKPPGGSLEALPRRPSWQRPLPLSGPLPGGRGAPLFIPHFRPESGRLFSGRSWMCCCEPRPDALPHPVALHTDSETRGATRFWLPSRQESRISRVSHITGFC